jgi:hypothetical protein
MMHFDHEVWHILTNDASISMATKIAEASLVRRIWDGLKTTSDKLVWYGLAMSIPLESTGIQDLMNMTKNHERVSIQLRIFETLDDYVGVGPRETKAGDVIRIVKEGSTLFTIRNIDDFYVIIENYFVQDLMEGELEKL